MSLKRAAVQGDSRWVFGARGPVLRGNPRSLGIPAKTVNRRGPRLVRPMSENQRLLAVAQSLITDKGPVIDKHGNERSAFKYRVSMCQRGLHGIPPAIYGNKRGDRAEFRDVQTCGSTWHCPQCAGKVTSGRRDELNAMVAGWSACDGAAVYLLTYTHSHVRDGMTLAEHLAAMKAAYKSLCNSKGFKRVMKSLASAGAVRALEVTHGTLNGWHPHIHALLFVTAGADRQLAQLRKLWVRELVKAGLSGLQPGMVGREVREQLRYLMRHSLDIRDGKYAAEYVAKFGLEPSTEAGGRWGLASEATKGHMKGGDRLKGRTPFELLRIYAGSSLTKATDAMGPSWAGDLFKEYAYAFHGSRQLVPSPGLRQKIIDAVTATLNLDLLQKARILAVLRREKTDAEIAAAPDKLCTEKIIRLTFDDWRLILMFQARADVLDVALKGGDAVREYLALLRERPRPLFADVHEYHEDDFSRLPLTGDQYFLNPQRRAA